MQRNANLAHFQSTISVDKVVGLLSLSLSLLEGLPVRFDLVPK